MAWLSHLAKPFPFLYDIDPLIKNQLYLMSKVKGERGIRTLDSSFFQNYTGFQDRSYQPLSHLSKRHLDFIPSNKT